MYIPRAQTLLIFCVKALCEIIRKVFFTWVPLDIKLFVCDLVSDGEKRVSIDHDICFFTCLFEIPTAVLLSQCTGVGGCWWPNSMRASLGNFPSLMFKKSAPTSASAAEHMTMRRMPDETKMLPFM